MTVVIQLINRLNDVGSKCEKLKTAEKAEAIEIRAEAEVLFKVQDSVDAFPRVILY